MMCEECSKKIKEAFDEMNKQPLQLIETERPTPKPILVVQVGVNVRFENFKEEVDAIVEQVKKDTGNEYHVLQTISRTNDPSEIILKIL